MPRRNRNLSPSRRVAVLPVSSVKVISPAGCFVRGNAIFQNSSYLWDGRLTFQNYSGLVEVVFGRRYSRAFLDSQICGGQGVLDALVGVASEDLGLWMAMLV